jgi:pilus assembly protein CpaC
MTTTASPTSSKSVKGHIMKSGLFAACLLAASTFLSTLPATNPAYAGDLDAQVQDLDESRFVRMGLNKSVIVRLPAEARDVIIGNEEIVDAAIRRKNMVYLFARRTGQTNIFFFDAEGQQILSLDLEVAQDMTAIKKLLSRALPGHRITVDTANNNIILGGIARNPLEAKRAVELANQFASDGSLFGEFGGSVINTMAVEGEDQVMLKVKVVEIQRDVLKQLGVDFNAMLNAGKFAVSLTSRTPFSQNLLAPFQNYNASFTSGNNLFQPILRAMESDGLVRTLAEPNLTALTGSAATFQAGGEFPYQTCDRTFDPQSGATVSQDCETEFKEYGIKVNFTPTVINEGRINLAIQTEVSELSTVQSGEQNIPGVNKRVANTTLEMPSGGTMMLAGLIRESSRQTINGTPGLKKLPVLGTLFRSRDWISNETELVIIATPYLVRHTDEDNFQTPDEGYNPSTEKQAIFMGKLNKVYGKGAAQPGHYNGNVGFIVE